MQTNFPFVLPCILSFALRGLHLTFGLTFRRVQDLLCLHGGALICGFKSFPRLRAIKLIEILLEVAGVVTDRGEAGFGLGVGGTVGGGGGKGLV